MAGTSRTNIKTSLIQPVKVGNALENMRGELAGQYLKLEEVAERVSNAVGFPVSKFTVKNLAEEMNITWKKVAGRTPNDGPDRRLYVLADALFDIMKQLGLPVTPELKTLHDELKVERNGHKETT